jgi:uncharacterized protein
LAGTMSAVLISLNISANILKIYIGIMILLIGLFTLIFSKKIVRFSWTKILVLGVIASFNKGISGGGYGPLITGGQLLSGVKEKNAIAITSLAEGLTCAFGFFCIY